MEEEKRVSCTHIKRNDIKSSSSSRSRSRSRSRSKERKKKSFKKKEIFYCSYNMLILDYIKEDNGPLKISI